MLLGPDRLDGEDGELGDVAALAEESAEDDDGELGADGEGLADVERALLGLLATSKLVVLEVLSEACENVPRLVLWSRVSSSACSLKTRRAGTARRAVPLPPPDADCPRSEGLAVGLAVEGDDAFESRAAVGVELASLLLLAALGAEDSGTSMRDPFPEPLDALAAVTTGAEELASEPASVLLLLPFGVVLSAAFSEVVPAWRAARRFASAIAAWPSDWPKLPFGARTHSKLMVYIQVV